MSSLPQSPNFEFLREYDEQLVVLGARAERYVFDDPNTSLFKTRQLAEQLARHASARHGLDPTDLKFQDLIGLLWRQDIVPREIRELFDHLRLRCNPAVHSVKGDRTEALAALITVHHLAQWFHSTFGENARGPMQPFRPPPNPQHAEVALNRELEELRQQAESQREELEMSQDLVADQVPSSPRRQRAFTFN